MILTKKIVLISLLIIGIVSCSSDDPTETETPIGTDNPDPDPAPDPDPDPDPLPFPDIIIRTSKTCEIIGNGKLYEVGPGKEYEKIIDVPTENLGPGDVVKIYAKAEPYYERMIITTKGTESEPICICGVPDAKGKLPILDGTNARVRPIDLNPYFNTNTAYAGVIVVNRNFDNHPEYINISNLQLQGAHQFMQDDTQKTYKMGTDELIPYGRAASGISLRGKHFKVTSCIIRHNGNGIFGAYNGPENPLIDVRLSDNIIQGNGTFNVDRQHNVYLESEGVISTGNQFGPIREGSNGVNYKSRSAGDIIMFNRFLGPAGRQLNLVEIQNGKNHLDILPLYNVAYFAGNIIEGSAEGSATILHYGNDDNVSLEALPLTRQGNLYSYNNTFILKGIKSRNWRKMFFDITVCETRLHAFNNVLFYENPSDGPNTEVSIFRDHGVLGTFSNNLITSAAIASYNTRNSQTPCLDESLDFTTVESMMITDQEFGLDVNNLYRPIAGSNAIDAGMVIPSQIPKIEYQFKYPNGVEPRSITGSTIDIGAFEF